MTPGHPLPWSLAISQLTVLVQEVKARPAERVRGSIRNGDKQKWHDPKSKQFAALQLVRSTPNMITADIAANLGFSLSHTSDMLRVLYNGGMVVRERRFAPNGSHVMLWRAK